MYAWFHTTERAKKAFTFVGQTAWNKKGGGKSIKRKEEKGNLPIILFLQKTSER